MLDYGEQVTLSPIGVVHSSVVERREMPIHGVRAEVEVFPAYRDGLLLIEGNSHLWIVGWLAGAEREQLQIVRPEYVSGQRRRGVFGLRSTTRPNSIGLCVSALVEVRNGHLVLDHLDFLDGTPVLDIKRYSPSWDSVFSARSSRETMIDAGDASELDLLELDAARFHGAMTPAIVATARLMQHVIRHWQVLPRDPELTVGVPASGMHGEYIDALQGITAATFGSGRLQVHNADDIRLAYRGSTITAIPLPTDTLEIDDVRSAAVDTIYTLRES